MPDRPSGTAFCRRSPIDDQGDDTQHECHVRRKPQHPRIEHEEKGSTIRLHRLPSWSCHCCATPLRVKGPIPQAVK